MKYHIFVIISKQSSRRLNGEYSLHEAIMRAAIEAQARQLQATVRIEPVLNLL